MRFADGGPHFSWDVHPHLTLRDTTRCVRDVAGVPGVWLRRHVLGSRIPESANGVNGLTSTLQIENLR